MTATFEPLPTYSCTKCNKDCSQAYNAVFRRDGSGEPVPETIQCLDCADAERLDEYKGNGVLTTKLLLNAAMAHQRFFDFGKGEEPDPALLDIKAAIDRLKEVIADANVYGRFDPRNDHE